MKQSKEETIPAPLLLTVPQVARLLNLGCTTVRMLLSSGSLPTIRIGRSIRISSASLREWVNQQEQDEVGKNLHWERIP